MKKFFLLIFFSILAVFLVAGCAKDNTKGGGNSDNSSTGNPEDNGTITPPTVTSIDLLNPSTLNGTYDITYFGTVVYNKVSIASALSNDCTKLSDSNLGKSFSIVSTDDMNSQGPLCANQTRILGGKITITVNQDTQMVSVVSKIQIVGPYFTGSFGLNGKDDIYSYTIYKEVPFKSITSDGVNAVSSVTGVSGRNMVKNTDNPNSTFVIKKQTDNSIFIDIVLFDKINFLYDSYDAQTNIEATKVSDTVETLDQNSLFITADQLQDQQEKELFQGFISNIQ